MLQAHALRVSFVCVLALAAISQAEAAAPRISGTPVTNATAGQAWSFQPTASDPDGDRLRFWVYNKPPFTAFSSYTGRLYGTAGSSDVGSYSNIVIVVSDGRRRAYLPAFTLTVTASGNKPPTITGAPSTTAKVGTAYSFQPTASDPEGKALSFAISGRPTWATFSSTTGRLSGTPTTSGTYGSIRISASDGTSSASLPMFSITVSDTTTTNSPPTISGSPATSVTVGSAYSFQPTAADANQDPLGFSVTNLPGWAIFSTSTGRISGTPTAANVGTTNNIVISVSDGKASASLQAFSVTVAAASGGGTVTGTAALSWVPPTANADGSALTNLAGYKVSYGQSATTLTNTITLANPGLTGYVVENLGAGTWYFGVRSYSSNGQESTMSNITSKTVN